MVKSIDRRISSTYQRLMCQTGGGAVIRQQPERCLINHLWECRGHFEFGVEFVLTSHWDGLTFRSAVHWVEECHASFCWSLVSFSSLTRQPFIVPREALATLRECGCTSSYPSTCGLSSKRLNFETLVHSSCVRSGLAAVYSPGLKALYLCEIRWWSFSSLISRVGDFFFLLDFKSVATGAQTAVQLPSSYSGATVGGVESQSWTYKKRVGVERFLPADELLSTGAEMGTRYLILCWGGRNPQLPVSIWA